MKTLIQLLDDESAATAIEYSLFVALISMTIIGATTALGDQLNDTFGQIAASFVPAE